MQKIMFNDKYGLTNAVLEGRKNMTRRIVCDKLLIDAMVFAHGSIERRDNYIISKAPYKAGEIVAVAQPYKDVANTNHFIETCLADEWRIDYRDAGWNNKMFVKPCLMPHQIRITDIKVERLQDISEEDVYREGFRHEFVNNGWGNAAYHEETILVYYDDKGRSKQIRDNKPKEAFSFLIDKISGIGTWESNPWVFVYSYELVK